MVCEELEAIIAYLLLRAIFASELSAITGLTVRVRFLMTPMLWFGWFWPGMLGGRRTDELTLRLAHLVRTLHGLLAWVVMSCLTVRSTLAMCFLSWVVLTFVYKVLWAMLSSSRLVLVSLLILKAIVLLLR